MICFVVCIHNYSREKIVVQVEEKNLCNYSGRFLEQTVYRFLQYNLFFYGYNTINK